MEGYRDPFNRRPYPWGREDTELLAHYRRLSEIRRVHAVFADGETRILHAQNGVFVFERGTGDEILRICVNRSAQDCPMHGRFYDLLTDTEMQDGVVAPDSVVILRVLK